DLTILVLIFLSVFLLFALIKIFHKLWWVPTHLQYLMSLQGIKCRPYKFVHGNTKEISAISKESMSRPMGLSHEICPRLQPHIHCWSNLYGKIYVQWYGPQAQLVILEPELIKELLNNRDKASHKPEVSPYTKKILGDGLTMSQGEKWAKMRKLANFAFHGESLKVSSLDYSQQYFS
ncbi:hypothetical protein TorRG33x02_070160, partial [Trema orientale]